MECPNCGSEMEKTHVIAGNQIYECPSCGVKQAPAPYNNWNEVNNED